MLKLKTIYPIAMLAIFLLVVLSSGCTMGKKHFGNDEISFDYPGTWKCGAIVDLPGVIVGVSKSSQVDVKISKQRMPSGYTLKDVYNEARANNSQNLAQYCYQPLSERTLTVDGSTAYEIIYKIGCDQTQTRQQFRSVWLEKNGFLYIIFCTVMPPEDFDKENTNFDVIVNSFHVK